MLGRDRRRSEPSVLMSVCAIRANYSHRVKEPTGVRLETVGARVIQKVEQKGMRVLKKEISFDEEKKACFTAEFDQLRRSNSEPQPETKKFWGAALWERLSMDEVTCILSLLKARDLGSLGVSHRAFGSTTEAVCEWRVTRGKGRIQRRPEEPWWRTLRAIQSDKHSKDIVSAGGSHELFISEEGLMYSRGRGTCGQLGLGADIVEASSPTKVEMKHPVSHVAAGAYASLAITKDGELFTFGKTSQQQQVADVARPRPVLFPRSSAHLLGPQSPKILRCSAGNHHCLAVDDHGLVWSWGKNTHGQLGLGSVRAGATPPRLIRSLAATTKCFFVSAGAFHSLVIDKEGALYGFGLGADGRLGLGHSLNASLPERVLIPDSDKTSIIHCDAGVAHSSCIDSQGFLYTWGDPARGALGHTDIEASRAPKKVNFSENVDAFKPHNGASVAGKKQSLGRILKARCSLVRTLALDDDGCLWSIANQHIRKIVPPKKYLSGDVIRDIACASEDTVLVATGSGHTYLDLSCDDARSTTGPSKHLSIKVKAHSAG